MLSLGLRVSVAEKNKNHTTNLEIKMKLSHKLLMIFFILSFSLAYPCTTKVSEWTMLNFPPAFYELIYFTNKKLDKQTMQKQKKFRRSFKDVNMNFDIIDVTHYKNENVKIMFEMAEKDKMPFYALYYKNQLFTQFKSTDELQTLLESPLLTKIYNELMGGKLCVLLLLKNGDQKQNDHSADVLNKYLSGSILKDIIPLIHLNPDNEQERMFIKILLNVENDLAFIKEPMLFGIFGRLRILEPLVGKGITTENINYLIQFLSADCSCVIKTQMPGIDMLYFNKWNDVKPALLNNIITE